MTRADYETLRRERPDLKLIAWDSFQEWVHDAFAALTEQDIITRATAGFMKDPDDWWEWVWVCELLEPEAI